MEIYPFGEPNAAHLTEGGKAKGGFCSGKIRARCLHRHVTKRELVPVDSEAGREFSEVEPRFLYSAELLNVECHSPLRKRPKPLDGKIHGTKRQIGEVHSVFSCPAFVAPKREAALIERNMVEKKSERPVSGAVFRRKCGDNMLKIDNSGTIGPKPDIRRGKVRLAHLNPFSG